MTSGKKLKMEKKYPSAILLIGGSKIKNFFNEVLLRNLGYEGDIIPLEDSKQALYYFTGITSELLPKPKTTPNYLVFLDLKTCQQANWNLLNQFLTFPVEKRGWFNFIVFGSEADVSARDYALIYKYVVHFESKVINGQIFEKILTLINSN